MDIDDARWYIGGWGDRYGNHYDSENGVDREPADYDLPSAAYIQVHIEAVEGAEYQLDRWITIHGPWEAGDWDVITEYVNYVIENDGES